MLGASLTWVIVWYISNTAFFILSIKSNKPKEIYDIAAVIAKNLGWKTEKLYGDEGSSYYNNDNNI